MSLQHTSILLIISGGIAAYKSLELIRLLKKSGASVRAILTKGGEQFVTPLSVSALCENDVYQDLWSLKDESEMGHIRLSRESDLIVIAPASANLITKMACGLADDLASTTLLAANKPVLIAPAMNHVMWENPATQNNIQTLKNRGVTLIGPEEGDMACGEYGTGRMSDPETIIKAITKTIKPQNPKPLEGFHALVTSGPTYEPLDPVRFIGNRSSGKQGYAIATSLHNAGAQVTLISGPVHIPPPSGIQLIRVETAEEMLNACERALPADIAVCTAAVSDWRAKQTNTQKIKKAENLPPNIALTENPDILKTLSSHPQRPELVIGFAAETENLIEHAKTKLKTKKCDWILANNLFALATESTNRDIKNQPQVFNANENHVHFISSEKHMDWGRNTKNAIGQRLTNQVIEYFEKNNTKKVCPHAAE